MAVCAQCSAENPDHARYCLSCAAPLDAVQEALPEQRFVRKTVTALFCDVTSSTELGERLDPETMRRVLFRYFDEMRAILERHGGTVEKFAGDAVMAVFGVPVVHEDDALRAVRAAEEMLQRLAELNNELESVWGVELGARIGINTGEVVASESPAGTVTTGDPVNVAARLQQAAEPGEILFGKETYRLVSHAIEAGPLEAIPVKGKTKPLAPWRLEKVLSGAPRVLRQESRLVGRARELAELEALYERTVEERRCRLAAVVGGAGVGKSRLAEELGARLLRAVIASGRCLAYGDGITFWPLREIVRQLAGIASEDTPDAMRTKIMALLPPGEQAERICDGVAGTLGLPGFDARNEETFWAVRKLLEAAAQRHPLVLVLEDIHWAEPTLLDLLEYLVGWVRDVPIVLLCLARPELLEERPSWLGGTVDAAVLRLEPLGQDETRELVANLLESAHVPDDVASLIMGSAEGNPLFVEELLRMLLEDGNLRREDEGGWTLGADLGPLRVPPTINALLTARLDRLDPGERQVIQRAAVAGKQFWWSAVVELSDADARADVGRHLQSLVRRRLVLPEEGGIFVGEDVFRFAHILVRDAAYATLPKELRAQLHERFAWWVRARAAGRQGELDEIIGYHLEQAYAARAALGLEDEVTRELAHRAADVITTAGRRAFARGDMHAAASLLMRATVLRKDEGPARLTIAPDLAVALMDTGEFEQAKALLDAAVDDPDADEDVRAHARIVLAHLGLQTESDGVIAEATRVGEQGLATFAALGDDLGVAQAWRLLALSHSRRAHWQAAGEFLENALEHAERAGNQRERAAILNWLGWALYYGPTPVDQAIQGCDEYRRRAEGERTLEAGLGFFVAGLHAMLGRFDDARDLAARSRATFEDLGVLKWLAAGRYYAGDVELLAGDAAAAAEEFRWVHDTLLVIGDRVGALEAAYQLANALYACDAVADAQEVLAAAEDEPGGGFVLTDVAGLSIRAKLLARDDQAAEAERLARRAVAIADTSDTLNVRGDARLALAEVLRVSGRAEEVATPLRAALALYRKKGNLVRMEAVRAQIDGGPASPAPVSGRSQRVR